MKKIYFLLFFILGFCCVNAQETGMHFVSNSSWKKVLAKAKKENKYIFVDCFTTTCLPCKIMSNNVFPNPKVGVIFNAHFVNVKLQLNKTNNDNSDVKAWYATSQEIQDKYEVYSFPTYLIFNYKGELVHRFTGSMSDEDFITKGKEALVPDNQYYTQLRKYRSGERGVEFLKKMTLAASEANDKDVSQIANDYFVTQTNLFTKENLELIVLTAKQSTDIAFKILLNDMQRADSVLGVGIAEQIVQTIIFKEELSLTIPTIGIPIEPNWIEMERKIYSKYPTMALKTVLFSQKIYYYATHNWKKYALTIDNYVAIKNISPEQLNQSAWEILQNSNDISCINSALLWSKKSFETENNQVYFDTYANLLFKTGKKQEAINWETKAFALAKEKSDPSIGGYERTLSEMKVKKYISEDVKQDSPIKEPD